VGPAAVSVSFTIPLRTVSEINSHAHWRARQKRAKAQRSAAFMFTMWFGREMARRVEAGGSLIVTITRIAPRSLDSDNLAGSQKHVRDGIADAIGIDDRDPRVEWRYAQSRGARGQYSVEVNVAEGQVAA
jgi:hypothetical protein